MQGSASGVRSSAIAIQYTHASYARKEREGREARGEMTKPNLERGFWAKVWPPLPGIAIASIGWLLPDRDQFGLGPSGTAGNAFLIIGMFWSCVLTAWAMQRGAESPRRRFELATFGLIIGILCASATWFVPMAVRFFFV